MTILERISPRAIVIALPRTGRKAKNPIHAPWPERKRWALSRSFFFTCKYFSIGFNGKFKDGQPFTNYATRTNADGSVTILPYDARGINLANNAFGKRKDAFFNFELRATGRWWANEIPMSLEVLCYNIYDFGTALTEYTFDQYNVLPDRTTMSLCIPRGLIFTLHVGLSKDKGESN